MALVQSLEKQGNFLFKYRGQFPVLLFILVVPFIRTIDYLTLSLDLINYYMYTAIFLSSLGFFIRFYTIVTPGPPFRYLYVQPTAKSISSPLRSIGTTPTECDKSQRTFAPTSCAF